MRVYIRLVWILSLISISQCRSPYTNKYFFKIKPDDIPEVRTKLLNYQFEFKNKIIDGIYVFQLTNSTDGYVMPMKRIHQLIEEFDGKVEDIEQCRTWFGTQTGFYEENKTLDTGTGSNVPVIETDRHRRHAPDLSIPVAIKVTSAVASALIFMAAVGYIMHRRRERNKQNKNMELENEPLKKCVPV
ncbi:hypothetical protein MAR_034633 [Mya arenaria]|uniref:Uncharacterized protein n=1 Tax=Mya arenaria TaxID=6604 RepID=A0ABY7EKQ9_MYAAR|nr:uncharacterized protein LOC128240037 [Mya arenaria]WAR09557.1 hypothetical protein MAR_034633 [Mya arenaria]